ncbi:ATP-binding protein [Salmonella enterica]|nr:AAA family ATPase [Salmonella enterica]EGA2422736.1 ATP-binding protein [Salmonella enterica]EGD2773613.1 ATP-binding protein [Salmonella enterica]EGH1501067.1 ATP-binding protein [Salmonella enterica]EGH4833006.1 ATP-binding protein [Salmonella enterica]
MVNFKRREKWEALQAKHLVLSEDLEFAQGGKKPWHYENWQEVEKTLTCEHHGEYQARILTGPEYRGVPAVKSSRCPGCIREERLKVDVELRSLRVADLLDDAGIARRFEGCEFENYQPVNQEAAKNLAACQRYAQSWPERLASGTGLVMTGNCGTGKNHLAVSMAKNIIRNHLARVEITDVMRLTRAVKSTWRHDTGSTEDEIIERFASLDLLIIDEVGVQFGSPAEMTILQEIINARYESVLPTILISNLTFKQLKESVGERIVDRVTDGGLNRLAFGWESYRAVAGGVSV